LYREVIYLLRPYLKGYAILVAFLLETDLFKKVVGEGIRSIEFSEMTLSLEDDRQFR
jgi:hypothetical protein